MPSKNNFLQELLGLQQDGNESISSPKNWIKNQPLLEVSTELDTIIEDLAAHCLTANGNKRGRWFFFIGSPGNGKSAAVGKLVRNLIEKHKCRILDQDDRHISDLDDHIVPYSLNVFETNLSYSSVRIVQDASVVANPYESEADPARDLIDTLETSWNRGISLIVCTNRGVLEKAYRDTLNKPEINQKPWHKAILKALVEESNNLQDKELSINSKRQVFNSIVVAAKHLDSRSLLLSGNNVFRQLINKAVEKERWESCNNCSLSENCPFKANRDWLADMDGLEKILLMLKRAEVFSSQVIVFREALAIISFLLAGCSRDYQEIHPCDWVKEKLDKNDIFALGERRIYMNLFSSSYPRGLEKISVLRAFQTDSLKSLINEFQQSEIPYLYLKSTCDKKPPSTDVGVSRLLGMDGVFQQLDPLNGPLPPDFFDKWDGAYDRIEALPAPYISGIDKLCCSAWKSFESAAENMISHDSVNVFCALRRWSSQFTLHLGALIENRSLDSKELDNFTELLELLLKDSSLRRVEEKHRLSELREQVQKLLRHTSKGYLADNVSVKGEWIDRNTQPKIDQNKSSGSLSISIRFGNSNHYISFTASLYIWLCKRAEKTMNPLCIPEDLMEEAMDARSRAVQMSEYAFMPDVTLEINDGMFTLTRLEEMEVHFNAID